MLGPCVVAEGGNEIGALLELLAMLDLKGRIETRRASVLADIDHLRSVLAQLR